MTGTETVGGAATEEATSSPGVTPAAWAGLMLDCPDATELATFYGELTGWGVGGCGRRGRLGLPDPAGHRAHVRVPAGGGLPAAALAGPGGAAAVPRGLPGRGPTRRDRPRRGARRHPGVVPARWRALAGAARPRRSPLLPVPAGPRRRHGRLIGGRRVGVRPGVWVPSAHGAGAVEGLTQDVGVPAVMGGLGDEVQQDLPHRPARTGLEPGRRGWASSRSATSATIRSVRRATSSKRSSTPASVSPGRSRKPPWNSSWRAAMPPSKAEAPTRTKSSHWCSMTATCLTRPARVSSLTVVRRPACSSSRFCTVNRRKKRRCARLANRSARSPVGAGLAVASVAGVASVLVVVIALLPFVVRLIGVDARGTSGQNLTSIMAGRDPGRAGVGNAGD